MWGMKFSKFRQKCGRVRGPDLMHWHDEKLLRMKAITTFLAARWFNKRRVRVCRKASIANIRFQCSQFTQVCIYGRGH